MINRILRSAGGRPAVIEGGPRLLLVDDDGDELILLRDQLARAGMAYEVAWSSSYEGGLELLRRGDFAVALIDYRLGGKSGLDLLRDAIAENCRVPMIMLTGERDPRVDRTASELGAVDFLVKGKTEPHELERAVRYAMTQGRALEAVLLSTERVRVLEEIGHRLNQDSPDPEALCGIMELIASRVGRSQLAIYLGDGSRFKLEASVGYQWTTPRIELSGHVASVLQARRPRLIPNQTAGRTSIGTGVSNELCLPLLEGAEPVGLLLVGSPDDHPVDGSEYPFFEAVAERLATALTLAQDRRDLAARQQRFRRLSTFAATLAASSDADVLRESLAAATAMPLSADRARICGPVRGQDSWEILSTHGTFPWVSGTVVTLDELEQAAVKDGDMKSSSDPSSGRPDANVMVVPIMRATSMVGLLRLERAGPSFDVIEREAAALMADILAVALDARRAPPLELAERASS